MCTLFTYCDYTACIIYILYHYCNFVVEYAKSKTGLVIWNIDKTFQH